ncbi:hypothetical protein BDN67DRAFT_973331 [Paxillus ammoniavirescens]|nr:hypothetical protein BDN67DRAFT_973331 [Paxillus ammoniavirescens]
MSLSDVSDLTELSSDEEEVPLSKNITKKKKGPKEYRITNVLRAPRTTQYTAKSLYDQIIENAIDLDPEYQRDVVWQEEKQSGLIDSILRNYYIPPIIFAVSFQDDGSELRTCIDGKQRLTSIQRFIDGQIPHKDSFTNEKLWFRASATNARRKLLPPQLRTQFTNKQIVCVEYNDLNNDQEREIFQRVQLGVALSPAERLQAIVGPWSTVIREIQSQVLGEEGFEGYLDWGHARGRDFQCLATIGYLIEFHPKSTVPGTKSLERWLQRTDPVSPKLRADLHETFRIFLTLARDKKYSGSLNRPTRVSPIEFVMIGVLIYLKRSTLSLTQISSAIEKMRKDVRASHQDIRTNTRVTKHLMDFMAKKIKVSELKSDGEGDKPAASAITKSTKSVKRKRTVESDSDVPDAVPSRKAKTTKPATASVATPAPKATKQSSAQKKNGLSKGSPLAVSAPTTKLKVTKTTSAPSQLSTRTASTPSSSQSPAPTAPTAPTKKSPPLPTPITSNHLSTAPTKSTPRPTPEFSTYSTNVQAVSLGSTPSTATASDKRPPLTVQTAPAIKGGPPQIGPLNSPSAFDRLAPIRAAKASLQSPVVSNGNETKPSVSPGISGHQTLVNSLQNPSASQPAASLPPLPSQPPPPPPPPPPSAPLMSQPIDTAQVEGILRALQGQFQQFGYSGQNQSNGAVNGTLMGQSARPVGAAGITPPIPSSVPTFVNNGYTHTSSQVPQGSGVGVAPNQGTYQGGISGTQTQLQANSHPLPPNGFSSLAPPPLSSGAPTPVVLQPRLPGLGTTLPQRPMIITAPPSASIRAEPLYPPPTSASSTGSFTDDRRGPGLYSSDRRRDLEERKSGGHDYDRDRDRDRGRDRSDSSFTRDPRRDPSRTHDRHRDDGWGSRGRGGYKGRG